MSSGGSDSGGCYHFGALKVCDGDIVVIELTNRTVVHGVVVDITVNRRFGFIALSNKCGEEPVAAVALRRIARVARIGRCDRGGEEDKAPRDS